MPQIDKLTFMSTVYWIVAFYFFLYLDVNTNYLYSYLVSRKLLVKRLLWTMRKIQVNMMFARTFSNIGL